MRSLALVLAGAAAVALAAAPAAAKPHHKAKRYHFQLADVTTKAGVAAGPGTEAATRVKAEAAKQIAANPQLLATLDGAPDPASAPAAFQKYLLKHGITGAYKVSIEVTEATEEVEPVLDKPSTQRIVVHLSLHMFGEVIPTRKMGFTGDGSAVVKVEIGKKVRKRDRDYTWDSAAQEAMTKAIEESLHKLSLPAHKPSRK